MSGAMSRRKGYEFERVCRNWLIARYGEDQVYNPAAAGHGGDDIRFRNLRMLSLEAKNQKQMNLSGWLRQAVDNATDAGLIGAVIHKKRGTTDVGEHYVTMRASDFFEVLDICRGMES